MNQAYSRLSTTHGHITDCKLVCMYLTRLVLVRPAVFIAVQRSLSINYLTYIYLYIHQYMYIITLSQVSH